MAENIAFNPHLGSFTSGVDGSSEGGRIDTIRIPNVLVLYGVSLVNQLKAGGYTGGLNVRPQIVDGVWVLGLEYDGEEPPPARVLWHGHRVIVEKKPPPPAQDAKK